MGRLLILEPFDAPIAEPAECGPSEDWEAGHAIGFLAGRTAEAARRGMLRDDVAQSIMDISFTYAEARSQILESFAPLVARMLNHLLPALAKETLLPQIVDQVCAAARADSQSPMHILLNPETLAGVQEGLPAGLPLPIFLEADPALGLGQALLKHHQTETMLDLDGLVAGIRASFAAYSYETGEKKHHG